MGLNKDCNQAGAPRVYLSLIDIKLCGVAYPKYLRHVLTVINRSPFPVFSVPLNISQIHSVWWFRICLWKLSNL